MSSYQQRNGAGPGIQPEDEAYPVWGLDPDCVSSPVAFPVALDKIGVFSFSLGYIQNMTGFLNFS